MRYRRFGQTEWRVSELSLGTVELGMEYGLYAPGEAPAPSEAEARRILLSAFERGVNLVDTAPGYGLSEARVGAALRDWRGEVHVATKAAIPDDRGSSAERRRAVLTSLERSRARLGRDCLDLVQIHNATVEELRGGEVLSVLADERARGTLHWIGASVYGTAAALEALRHPEIAILQVAYNVLDQRMAGSVFASAATRDVALLVRSVLLKGVLSDRRELLPERLGGLRQAADRTSAFACSLGERLSALAIRFCLSDPRVGSVLLGVRSVNELSAGIAAAAKPQLCESELVTARGLALEDEVLVDPSTWGTA